MLRYISPIWKAGSGQEKGYEAEHLRLCYGRRQDLTSAEGRLVNLASGDGHPAEIMDMSFALQALSAKYVLEHHSTMENRVYKVPEEIDHRVATMKLSAMGIQDR